MPVPRVQRKEDVVKYVVMERNEEGQAQEVEIARVVPTPTPTTFINSPHVQPRATVLQIIDNEEDRDPDRKPQVWTLTVMSGAQATGALAANNPTATVVVAIPPPPREREGDGGGGGGGGHRGISQTTEHLLIAAGSIGATIIIVMAVLAIYTIRKRGVSLTQTIKQRKIQVPRRGPPPPLKFQGECAAKQSFSNDYGALRTHTVTPPPAAIARSGSSLSQCPSTGPNRNDSFNLQSHRKPSADMVGSTFLLESPPLPRCNNSHRRDPSATPSSPILGQQDLRRSASTHNTRSVEDDASELRYGDTSQERAQSPLPPPPTFKQFLNNRPSISGKSGFGGMTSRFSWTNSNAPQTPHEPNRDTYQAGRESYMTTRSSVHRFRTVDSWVNQQSNRIEAQKLREQFRLTSTSTVYSGDDENDHVPKVPAMPKNVEQLREYSAPMSASLPLRAPLTPPLPISKSLPGRNIRHERRDSRTTIDTAPIFKHHPGTEVRFSTRSAVPSEILDRGRIPNVLS